MDPYQDRQVEMSPKKEFKYIFLKICPWKIAKKKLTQNFILYLAADFRTKCKFMPESFQMDT